MEKHLPSVVSDIDNFIAKSKRYLQPGEKPPKGVRVLTGPRGAKFYYTSRRVPKKGAKKDSMKGKWMVRRPKVPVFVTIDVPKAKGKERTQKPYTVKKRTQWVSVDRAMKGGYEIDFEKLHDVLYQQPGYEQTFKLLPPEDTRRLHEHKEYKGEHPVSKKHTSEKVIEEHNKEKKNYSNLYLALKTKQTPGERKIRQKIAAKTQKLEQLLRKKYKKKIDVRKKNVLLGEINQAKKELKEKHKIELLPTKVGPKKKGKDRIEEVISENIEQEPSWMDDYKVGRIPNQAVEYKGKKYEAEVFVSPDVKNKIYLFRIPERKVLAPTHVRSYGTSSEYDVWTPPIKTERSVHYPEQWCVATERAGVKTFRREGMAMKAIEMLFTDPNLKSSILMKQQEILSMVDELKKRIFAKQLDLQKRDILNKVSEMIESGTSFSPTDVLPVEDVSGCTKTFTQFKSGDDKVTLESENGQYKVCTNGVISTTTDCFQEALSKYYSSVSRIIDTQNEDKDIALELFGEHVLNTSRNTRKLMAELDRMAEVKMLENIDYSAIEIPFEPEKVLKADPTGDFFGIVPVTHNSEEVECQSEIGRKIGRKDLEENDYYENERQNDEQEVINEEESDGLRPAIIMRSMEDPSLNQVQKPEFRPEESKRNEIVEKPLKVEETYQQNLRNPENAPIEQRWGVN